MSAVVQRPRAVELVERRKLRKKIARAVSRLIAILDELDSDPEAEPWLGAPEPVTMATCWGGYLPGMDQRRWADGANDDREAVNEDGDDLDRGEDDRSDLEEEAHA